jgi:CheY-like chemotaxis protein
MPNVLLIHWDAEALQDRAERLERAGYDVAICSKDGSAAFRAVGASAPHAVVIDLSRQPSHGKRLAIALREKKTTRHIPLVFVDGEAKAVSDLKRMLPDASYASWRSVSAALKRAIAKPPAEPVVPSNNVGKSVGYSGTPLPKKLGINEGSRVALISAPAGIEASLAPLPAEAATQDHLRQQPDVIVLFSTSLRDVERRFAGAAKALANGGGLWIAWPKKSSGVASDLSEDAIRAVGLAAGLVDSKVCAVDATWSGLRFMRRRTATRG